MCTCSNGNMCFFLELLASKQLQAATVKSKGLYRRRRTESPPSKGKKCDELQAPPTVHGMTLLNTWHAKPAYICQTGDSQTQIDFFCAENNTRTKLQRMADLGTRHRLESGTKISKFVARPQAMGPHATVSTYIVRKICFKQMRAKHAHRLNLSVFCICPPHFFDRICI